ncbi:collectin-11 isoform X1 [Mustela nigripes]|uniref:collectin-11 isoform X1 n=1 Tax=Mustela nigripes TaxID=77151 RepID=UPI0028154ED1|nr:collectin-11 isoform X1 [Mustela nigripes]
MAVPLMAASGCGRSRREEEWRGAGPAWRPRHDLKAAEEPASCLSPQRIIQKAGQPRRAWARVWSQTGSAPETRPGRSVNEPPSVEGRVLQTLGWRTVRFWKTGPVSCRGCSIWKCGCAQRRGLCRERGGPACGLWYGQGRPDMLRSGEGKGLAVARSPRLGTGSGASTSGAPHGSSSGAPEGPGPPTRGGTAVLRQGPSGPGAPLSSDVLASLHLHVPAPSPLSPELRPRLYPQPHLPHPPLFPPRPCLKRGQSWCRPVDVPGLLLLAFGMKPGICVPASKAHGVCWPKKPSVWVGGRFPEPAPSRL